MDVHIVYVVTSQVLPDSLVYLYQYITDGRVSLTPALVVLDARSGPFPVIESAKMPNIKLPNSSNCIRGLSDVFISNDNTVKTY